MKRFHWKLFAFLTLSFIVSFENFGPYFIVMNKCSHLIFLTYSVFKEGIIEEASDKRG